MSAKPPVPRAAKGKSKSASKGIVIAPPTFDGLVSELREFITESRRQVVRAVDVIQVRTCWGVGRHIIEFEQGGAVRAEYGARLLPRLAEALTADFGKGFDERNLRYMREFYSAFPNRNALRSDLSWTHYRILMRVEDLAAREWYINESISQNWSSRAGGRAAGLAFVRRATAGQPRPQRCSTCVRRRTRRWFASRCCTATSNSSRRYKLVLPSEEVLRQELIREQLLLEEQRSHDTAPPPSRTKSPPKKKAPQTTAKRATPAKKTTSRKRSTH